MEKYNKLVRNKVPNLLENKNYKVKTKKLDEKQLKIELYSLFLSNLKNSERTPNKQLTCYADMLEVIRTLAGTKIDNIDKDVQNQPLKWYKRLMSKQVRINQSRTNLLEKYDELIQIKNVEVFQEQLKEVCTAFKELVEAKGSDFKRVQALCEDRMAKLGGFSQGIYLEGVENSTKVETAL